MITCFDRHRAKIMHVLADLDDILDSHGNIDRLARTLEAILQAVRNLLVFETGLVLLRCLPEYLRPWYLHGWNPHQNGVKKIQSMDDLLEEARNLDKHASIQDFTTRELAEDAIVSIFYVLAKYTPEARMKKLLSALPDEISRNFEQGAAKSQI